MVHIHKGILCRQKNKFLTIFGEWTLLNYCVIYKICVRKTNSSLSFTFIFFTLCNFIHNHMKYISIYLIFASLTYLIAIQLVPFPPSVFLNFYNSENLATAAIMPIMWVHPLELGKLTSIQILKKEATKQMPTVNTVSVVGWAWGSLPRICRNFKMPWFSVGLV